MSRQSESKRYILRNEGGGSGDGGSGCPDFYNYHVHTSVSDSLATIDGGILIPDGFGGSKEVVVPTPITEKNDDKVALLVHTIDRYCCTNDIQIEITGDTDGLILATSLLSFVMTSNKSQVATVLQWEESTTPGIKNIYIETTGCGQVINRALVFDVQTGGVQSGSASGSGDCQPLLSMEICMNAASSGPGGDVQLQNTSLVSGYATMQLLPDNGSPMTELLSHFLAPGENVIVPLIGVDPGGLYSTTVSFTNEGATCQWRYVNNDYLPIPSCLGIELQLVPQP